MGGEYVLRLYDEVDREVSCERIEGLERELNETLTSERDQLLEFEIFVDVLQKASSYYRRCNYVQKAKVFEILFLHITIDNKKRLHLAVKPGLESIFNGNLPFGGDGGRCPHVGKA